MQWFSIPFTPLPLFSGTEPLRGDPGREGDVSDIAIGITEDYTAMLLPEARAATWMPLPVDDGLIINQYKAAEQMHRQELQIREEVLGREHPDTLCSLYGLARVLNSQGRYAEAEQMYRQMLELKERVLGREHPDTLSSVNNLARVLNGLGRYAEAEQMHRQTLELSEKKIMLKETTL